MSFALYEHQKKMLELLTENDRFMLLAEVGVGKSLPMLIHLSNLLLGGEIRNVLLVAPLSGLGAWTRDTEKLSADRQRVLRGAITYLNFDKLSRKTSRYQKDCWKAWDCIVLDESHAIAKPTSNRTQYFVGKGKNLGLASKCKYRYLITGTLINNSRLEDAWSPLRFILDDDWMTWVDFKRHYLVTKQLPGSYVELVIGYRHREELLATIARYSYRVLKKDCLDLPEELPDEVITVPWATGKNAEPFGKPTRELYDDALESYVEALDKVMDNPLSRLMAMRQIATGHVKESDTRDERGAKVVGETYPLNSLKTRYAMELIENNRPRKTVVFYNFKASCASMERALKARHIPYVTLNGDQPDKNIWRTFQSDPAITVILVQYQAGSVAIDLFASSYTLYYEPTDSSNIMEQSRARTHRAGQKQTCSYVFLLTEGSVEMDMYAKLNSHQDFSERLYRDVARSRLTGAVNA
jgi:SNF2 family DNA or RNA helicase